MAAFPVPLKDAQAIAILSPEAPTAPPDANANLPQISMRSGTPDVMCCVSCFSNTWLKAHLKAKRYVLGDCPFCGSVRRRLVRVTALYTPIQNMLQMYVPIGGIQAMLHPYDVVQYELPEPLLYLIEQDWEVFSDLLESAGKTGHLLEAIANSYWDDDDGEPMIDAFGGYSRREPSWRDTLASRWRNFSEAVRNDPSLEPNFHELFGEDLSRAKGILKSGAILYRARRGHALNSAGAPVPYTGCALAAPPPALARAGRGNPPGVSRLYCATNEHTAVMEVRPAPGTLVSAGPVRIRRDLRLLDLANVVPDPNPFVEDLLLYQREVVELLNDFGRELGTPVTDDNPRDYVPCQRLVDCIQRARFDAIQYPSAQYPEGINVLILDPQDGEMSDEGVRLVRAPE